MRATSGTYNALSFPLSELFLEAIGRGAEMFGPAIQQIHQMEARRSANIMLQGRWANRGLNLWATGDEQLCIPLLPGGQNYICPPETITIADAYLRTYTPSTTYAMLGNIIAPLGPANNPLVSLPYGDPLLISPGSGTFSTTAGSQYCTMNYPAHGLLPGMPLFWGCPVVVGGMTLYSFAIVDNVIDSNTLQFLLPVPAFESQTLQGGTPLFFTNVGSPNVSCISPGHGMSAGSTVAVPIATSVGGFPLSGSYTVASVQSPYQFTFQPTGANATSTAMAFENGGQISAATQQAGTQWTDIYLYPLGRTEWSQLPDKQAAGRPTQFWFNRTTVPQVVMWPVPPTYTQGQPPFYGFVAYRLRAIQDANPINGQTLDAPSRFYDAFCAELAAMMALKFRPSKFELLKQLAAESWLEAAMADREMVATNVQPDFTSYGI